MARLERDGDYARAAGCQAVLLDRKGVHGEVENSIRSLGELLELGLLKERLD